MNEKMLSRLQGTENWLERLSSLCFNCIRGAVIFLNRHFIEPLLF